MSEPRRKRILFILEFFPPHVGGVEVLFGELAAELVRRGYEVEVITSADPGEPRRETRDGVEIRRIAAPAFARRYLFMLMAVPAAIRAARKADLIHTTTYNAAIPAWIAARLARKKVIITAHEVFARQWNEMLGMNRFVGYAYRLFEALVLRLGFAHAIADSEFTRKRLIAHTQLGNADVTTVLPAVDHAFWSPGRHAARDLRSELGLPPDTFLYLYFGRPGVSKGVEYLVEAAKRVRAELPNARLVMILSREPAGQYRRITQRAASMRDHVILLDSVKRDALPSYLLAADCVIVPSISEGFGYSAIEAAALGCPLIATTGHATEELLGDYATFVPSRDPDALARAIVAASRHRARPAPLARRFTADAHAQGVIDVYRRVGVEV